MVSKKAGRLLFTIRIERQLVNLLFNIFLTFNATSWMIAVYLIKEKTFFTIPGYRLALIFLLFQLLLSILLIKAMVLLGDEKLEGCQEFYLADNEILPIYLGYFFIALSITDLKTMIFLYMMVFLFTFITRNQYFNPNFLLFGYHYYHIHTNYETKIFIIMKGKVIRNKKDIQFDNLKRLNDSTYIIN